MARKSRIHCKDGFYHICVRSQADRVLFHTDVDRRNWEQLVADGCERFGHRIHAYCWLKIEASMVVQAGETPLSKVMQNLCFRYTRYYNQQHGGQGSLFDGRYRSLLIEPDQYLTDLSRYIHQKPAQLKSTRDIANYRWSSLRSYLGESDVSWLTTDRVLDQFGRNQTLASSSYRKFVTQAADEELSRQLVHGNFEGRILGDSRFQRKVLRPSRRLAAVVSLAQLARYVCEQEGVAESQLKLLVRTREYSRIRQVIAWLSLDMQVASLSDIARRYNRDLTTMSRNQRNFSQQLGIDPLLQKKLRRYRRELAALNRS